MSTTRVPLQSGASALSLILFGEACWAVLGFGLYGFYQDAVEHGLDPLTGAYRTVMDPVKALLAIVVAVPLGVHMIARGIRARASDLLLREDSFAVEGGPFDGTVARWDELGSVLVDGEILRVFHKGGLPMNLGVAHSAEEVSSFEALASTIDEATLRAHGAASTAHERASVSLLRCPTCGAAVVPIDAPSTPCASCRAAVAIPQDFRDRLAARRTTLADERRVDRLVEKLVHRAGPIRTNVIVAIVAIACAGIFVVPFVIGFGYLPAAVALIFALYVEARADAHERTTHRRLLLGFSARPGTGGSGAPGCRACGGPLFDAASSFVRCPYCGAANLIGAEILGARATATDELALSSSLEKRRNGRLIELAWFVVALGLAWQANRMEEARAADPMIPTVQR